MSFCQWKISLALHIHYTEKSGRQTYSCVRAQSLNIASDMPKDFSGNIRLVQDVHRSEECAHKEVEVKQTFEVCTQELYGNLNLNLIAIMMARASDWERAKKRVTPILVCRRGYCFFIRTLTIVSLKPTLQQREVGSP